MTAAGSLQTAGSLQAVGSLQTAGSVEAAGNVLSLTAAAAGRVGSKGRGSRRASGRWPLQAPDASTRQTTNVDFQTPAAQPMGVVLPPKKRCGVDEADAVGPVAWKARVSTVLGRTPFDGHATRPSGYAFGRYFHRDPHDWGISHDP